MKNEYEIVSKTKVDGINDEETSLFMKLNFILEKNLKA